MIAELALAATLPSVVDWSVRTILYVASLRGRALVPSSRPRRWCVIVPARDEGAFVEPTLRSLQRAREAASDLDVDVVLLLDGPDAIAATIAGATGARIALKEPAGPTKAAALAWFAQSLAADAADAILLLDVGSRVDPAFFVEFEWPAGAGAVQAILRGEGEGAGAAAGLSERVAQTHEDAGRERLGWSVRLRGTGTALTPAAFRLAVGALVTRVEDLEMSLALAARGERCALGPPRAVVIDDKPHDVASAGAQRARWLLGRVELPLRRGADFVRLIARSPLEGLAFFFELFGRPLSLTALLRIGAAAAAIRATVLVPSQRTFWILTAVVLSVTVATDLFVHLRGSSRGAAGILALGAAWLRAVVLAPRALVKWMRAKRS